MFSFVGCGFDDDSLQLLSLNVMFLNVMSVMAVASLLPGTLPLGLGRLDPPGFGLKAYRWRKHGFPLKLFRKVRCTCAR